MPPCRRLGRRVGATGSISFLSRSNDVPGACKPSAPVYLATNQAAQGAFPLGKSMECVTATSRQALAALRSKCQPRRLTYWLALGCGTRARSLHSPCMRPLPRARRGLLHPNAPFGLALAPPPASAAMSDCGQSAGSCLTGGSQALPCPECPLMAAEKKSRR